MIEKTIFAIDLYRVRMKELKNNKDNLIQTIIYMDELLRERIINCLNAEMKELKYELEYDKPTDSEVCAGYMKQMEDLEIIIEMLQMN